MYKGKKLDIIVDFDGTVVFHMFPQIGEEVPGAVRVLKRLVSEGHNLILFTMRSDVKNPISDSEHIICEPGDYLTDAVKWFEERDIPLYGIQTNPTQHTWTTSPKAYGQIIIDDAALGCPLTQYPDFSSRPYVDWFIVEIFLMNMAVLSPKNV